MESSYFACTDRWSESSSGYRSMVVIKSTTVRPTHIILMSSSALLFRHFGVDTAMARAPGVVSLRSRSWCRPASIAKIFFNDRPHVYRIYPLPFFFFFSYCNFLRKHAFVKKIQTVILYSKADAWKLRWHTHRDCSKLLSITCHFFNLFFKSIIHSPSAQS